jgi:glycosyltransferase involved in cell wall biosynthesis
MRRHVLQVIASTDRRGAETFAADLRAAFVEQGRVADLVALAPGRTGGVSAPVLGSTRFAPSGLWTLHRMARHSDIVVGHGSSTLPACALATAGSGARFVYRNIGDPEFWANTRVRRARVRLLLRRTAAIAALWQGTADALVRSFGVPASKVVVIPNGRPAGQFPVVDSQARTVARARLGLGGRVVVYLGSLSEEKRVDLAIRAVSRVEDVVLLVAGEGPLRSALEDLALTEAAGRVRFLGSVAEPTLVLSAADALVLTSDSEGLPGVLIEAGLSGLPSVTTDAGGASTIVEDGVTGRVVPTNDVVAIADALREVLDDPTPLGQAARQRCLAEFEMDAVARRWGDFLDSVGRPG